MTALSMPLANARGSVENAAVSGVLPPWVATVDEAIPPPSERPLAAEPDMRTVTPIEVMLAGLAHADNGTGLVVDHDLFVERFRSYVREIGCSLLAHFTRDGDLMLNLGTPCDAQIRHRNRWMYYLVGRLEARDGRRNLLLRRLVGEGLVWDERPADPRRTTRTIRTFLGAGGRILISPAGHLEENGCPAAFSLVDPRADAVFTAASEYLDMRRRLRADRQIRRVVRALGRPVNGWMVLEGRP